MDSQRFFIALVPSQAIQASVTEIKRHFEQAYDSRKALNSPPHITLQAPFAWPQDRALEELTDRLRDFAREREKVAIAIRNFGTFPPKVIYLNVIKSPALMTLQTDLATVMKTHYGFSERRYRDFCPHMTVAFRDLTPTAFHQAWSKLEHQNISFDLDIQELTLLRHGGQCWQIHQTYPFNTASPGNQAN